MATIYGTNTKGLGHLLASCRDMTPEELAIHEASEAGKIQDEIDEKLAALEPLLIRSQFKRAVERLEEVLELALERDGPQAGRALLEKMALVAGDRRRKAMNVELDRRRS